MKNQMWLFIGSVVCIATAIGAFTYRDYLPPRTPYKIARIESNLRISKDFKVKDFEENYSFSGEGFVYVVFKLDDQQIESVIQECQKNNYKVLNTINLINDGFLSSDPNYGIGLHKKNIRDIKEGYYQLKAKDLKNMDFSITVLDKANKELIIYVSIP